MTNAGRKHESGDDRVSQSNGEDFTDLSETSSVDALSSSGVESSSVGSRSVSTENGCVRTGAGLTERLTDILVNDGDGDLLLQQSDREDGVLQWLQALDMQVMGACRADERLKPLFKINVSSGVAEDRLLAHFSQHFEPSEVGMLARCFCIPLVSIRVGKVNKEGTLLCPTATRGNFNLMILPTSDLRLSFVGDDGQTERLFTLSSKSQCTDVVINDIPTDNSGRSFLVRVPDGQVSYYWCSEKSKLLGTELLSKMKDLIKRKPSLAELTGISESRLGCFATELRAYLVGTTVSFTRASHSGLPSSSPETAPDAADVQAGQSSSILKSLRSRHSSSQALKANSLYQGSLSPRTSSFKEGPSRNLSSLRSAEKENVLKRGEIHLSVSDNLAISPPSTTDSCSCNQAENNKLPDVKSCPLSPNILESLGKFALPSSLGPASQLSSIGPTVFSPYYCWCPPGSSGLQQMTALPEFPTSLVNSFPLPPLSSLLPVNNTPSFLKPIPSVNLPRTSSLDFPALVPDPLVCLPTASSEQIPTFTPLMCDPIVHVPVIDVCSSGQAYLMVSVGPAISTTIPPLHPKLVNPLLSETDSVVEKSARETLRLLIGSSSQTSPPLLDILPAVLTNADEKRNIFVAGSRGLYGGTRDVNAIADGIGAMSLVTLSGGTVRTDLIKKYSSHHKLGEQPDESSDSDGSGSDSESAHSSNLSGRK